ncbi:hypothetical protein ACG1BZ_06290 [Microbulbifer sp. CNSA002]|uniref:hypothetical protein n=1 Tax=Microbulbifer sp. CNSA002 TaxID=3373604 RepID=UPI0039B3E95C
MKSFSGSLVLQTAGPLLCSTPTLYVLAPAGNKKVYRDIFDQFDCYFFRMDLIGKKFVGI